MNLFDKAATKIIASLIVHVLLASGVLPESAKAAWTEGLSEVIGYIGISATILISLWQSLRLNREKQMQSMIADQVDTVVTTTTGTAAPSSVTVATTGGSSVVSYLPEQ